MRRLPAPPAPDEVDAGTPDLRDRSTAAVVPADRGALGRILLGGVIVGLLALGILRIDSVLRARTAAYLRYTLALEPPPDAPVLDTASSWIGETWTVQAVINNDGPASVARLHLHLALVTSELVAVASPTVVATDPGTTIRPLAPPANAGARQHSADLVYTIAHIVPHEHITITLPCTLRGITARTMRQRYQTTDGAGQPTTELATVCLKHLSVTGDHLTLTRSSRQRAQDEPAIP